MTDPSERPTLPPLGGDEPLPRDLETLYLRFAKLMFDRDEVIKEALRKTHDYTKRKLDEIKAELEGVRKKQRDNNTSLDMIKDEVMKLKDVFGMHTTTVSGILTRIDALEKHRERRQTERDAEQKAAQESIAELTRADGEVANEVRELARRFDLHFKEPA